MISKKSIALPSLSPHRKSASEGRRIFRDNESVSLPKKAEPKVLSVPMTLGLENEKGKHQEWRSSQYILGRRKALQGVFFLSNGDLDLSDLHVDPRIESIQVKGLGLGIQYRYSQEDGWPERHKHLSATFFRASRGTDFVLYLMREHGCLNGFYLSNCM